MSRTTLSARERIHCASIVLALTGLFVVVRFVLPVGEAAPVLGPVLAQKCLLRSATGVPCPLCGGTRAVMYAARGEWRCAFLFNPLGAVLAVGLPIFGAAMLFAAVTGRRFRLTVPVWPALPQTVNLRLALLFAAVWAFKLVVACGLGIG